MRLVLLATDYKAYTELCAFITRGRRAAAKGSYSLGREDLLELVTHCIVLGIPAQGFSADDARWLATHFAGRAWLAAELPEDGAVTRLIRAYERLSEASGLPVVAAGNVHMHTHRRRVVQDTLTAIRLGVTLAEAGAALFANGQRYLQSLGQLQQRFPAAWLEASCEIARRVTFTLDDLRYRYPHELVPAGESASGWLRELTERGIRWRWPGGVSQRVRAQIESELQLIAELKYEAYFLTVHDIVRFARQRGILCQGRGSAANSAVCFCLGITEVDPERMTLLMERFISREPDEPEIDVDFGHERRE